MQSAPVLQDHRPERVATIAFPQAEDNVDAAQLLSPTGLGCLGAEAAELLRAEAKALVTPDGCREAAHLGDADYVGDASYAQGLEPGAGWEPNLLRVGDQTSMNDCFVETTQVKVQSDAVLRHDLRALVLDEAADRHVKAGVAWATGVPPTLGGEALLPLFQQSPPEFHPRFQEHVHQSDRALNFEVLWQENDQRNRPLLRERPVELRLPHDGS